MQMHQSPIIFKFTKQLKKIPIKIEFTSHQLTNTIGKCSYAQLYHMTSLASALSLTSATASAFASLVSGVSGLGSGAASALGSSTAGAACEPKKLTYIINTSSLGQPQEKPPKQV